SPGLNVRRGNLCLHETIELCEDPLPTPLPERASEAPDHLLTVDAEQLVDLADVSAGLFEDVGDDLARIGELGQVAGAVARADANPELFELVSVRCQLVSEPRHGRERFRRARCATSCPCCLSEHASFFDVLQRVSR